jgi:hypothetical protein
MVYSDPSVECNQVTFDKVFSTLMDWEDVYMSQIPFRTGTFDLAAVTLLESEINNLEKMMAEKRDKRDTLYNDMWDEVKRTRKGSTTTG